MQLTKTLTAAVAVAALGIAALATGATAGGARSVESDSMVGVTADLTGANGQIRGINGGGLPWSIGSSEVEVTASGKVEVSFNDLVFADGPNTGKNTVASMKVVVSCLDSMGATVNVSSALFPVTTATALDPGGDGSIETRLALPKPCLAPIVFVTNPAGAWFAVDGL